MSKVGELIKNKRMSLGLSIEDISSRTAIRTYILKAIEEGNFNEMPSYVHAHGFLEQYSKTLGLNFTETIKPLFEEECPKNSFGKTEGELSVEEEVKPVKTKESSKYKVIAFVFILLIGISAFAFIKISSTKSKPSSPAYVVPPVVTISPEPVVETPIIVQTPLDTEEIIVEPVAKEAVLSFNDECWTFINIDDNTTDEFTAFRGMTKTISFENNFKIHLGNASALKVIFNDQVFNNFGSRGAPLRNNYFEVDDEGRLNYSIKR